MCSKTLATMASKKVFQVLFAFISAYSAYSFAVCLDSIRANGYFPPGVTRLRLFGGSGGHTAATSSLSAVGLLLNGCKISEYEIMSSVKGVPDSNSAIVIGNMRPANGYFFVLVGGSSSVFPSQWVIESSQDNGSSWIPVGASVWRFAADGTLDLFPNLDYPQIRDSSEDIASNAEPTASRTIILDPIFQANTKVLVDLRPCVSWILSNMVQKFIYALGFLAFVVAGLLRKARHMESLWIGLLSSDILITLSAIAVVGVAEPWMWREAAGWWVYAAAVCSLLLGSIFYEKQFIAIVLAYSFLSILATSLSEVALYSQSFVTVLFEQLTNLSFIAGVLSSVAFIFRKRALARARRLVLCDCLRYDKIWNFIRKNPTTERSILKIRDEVRILLSTKEYGKVPRQFSVATPQTNAGQYTLKSIFRNEAIRSLDQLFVQAWCLNPILLAKVQSWALKSKGCFQCSDVEGNRQSFVRYIDLLRHPDRKIRWAKVKSVHRAIEKLVRAYGQVFVPPPKHPTLLAAAAPLLSSPLLTSPLLPSTLLSSLYLFLFTLHS